MMEERFDQQLPSVPKSKLYYPQATILIEDDSQLLLAFLKQLTFQSSLLPQPPLSPEEVEKLKTIIDKLHSLARKHKLSLKEMQGIWPLLSVMFAPINGLQLYLEFQRLLMPVVMSEVKQEEGQFSPSGYFQENNDWKSDKNIMSALRILERTLTKGSYERNKQEIYRFYELIAVDKAEFLITTKDIDNRLEQFRRNVAEARKIECSNKLTSLLSDGFFGIKGPTSEPDLLTNTLKLFTLREIEEIHETKTNKIVPIIEEDLEEEQNQFSPAKQSQTMSPPKHKNRIGCSDTTKLPRQRPCKNQTRFFYAKKFFELEKKQNIVLSEMKTKKALINRERHRRSKLEKMTSKSRKANYYHSEEEEESLKRTKRQISSIKHRQKDEYLLDFDHESEAYSASDERLDRYDEELSEEPVVKRNLKFHKKAPPIDPYFEMEVEEDYPIPTKRCPCLCDCQKQTTGKYKRDSIRVQQAEESIKTAEKLDNLEIRQLITAGGENFTCNFDFLRYRRYLESLEEKEVGKEARKIIVELVNRDSIAFDKSMLLKLLTFFSLALEKERSQAAWKLAKDSKIRIALKFIISCNIYRGNCEAINCFFDRNEDEATLLQAKEYFRILAEYVQAFKHVNIEQEVTQMIFDALLTPSRYRQLKNARKFSSQAELVQFSSPFLIARKALKYHLHEQQELVALLIGQLTLISLTLQRFFYDSAVSLQKQKQYFSQLNSELSQKKNDLSPFPYLAATLQMKSFYLMYRPRLNDSYLKGLVSFFRLSFNQLLIKSIKQDTEEEAKEHIEFVAAVFQDFIQKEFSKSPPAMGANVYSRLMKTQTRLKEYYENNKSANVALLFSTIFSLFLSWQQFRAANLGKQLMGTFKSTVLLGLESNQYKLKPALYIPILNCLYDLYSYKVELFLNVDHLEATEREQYQPMRTIVCAVWDKLTENYASCFKELKDTVKETNNKLQGRSKTEMVTQKLRRCEEGFTLFLSLFLLEGAAGRPNFPRQSFSHRFYCFQFILKQQHFIKLFQNAAAYPEHTSRQFLSCLIEVLQRWYSFLPTIDFFFQKYSAMILEMRRYYGNYEQKREVEFSLLSEVKQPSIQQCLANIYATQLIVTLIDHSKHSDNRKPINFLDNLVFKVLDQHTDPTLTSFAKISKGIHLFDHFLNRIIRFFEVEQFNIQLLGEQAKIKIKKAFYKFMKENFIKKITLLIMLAALAKNSYEYECIPLIQVISNLKKLRLFDEGTPVEGKVPFQCQLFFEEGIQRIQSFKGIEQVFAEILRWRNNSTSQQRNRRALEGFKVLFQDLYNCIKRFSSERQREAIPVEWMKWAAFAMQWPEILNSQRLLRDRAHLCEFKINTSSIRVFLNLLQVVESRSENIYRIKEISQVFIENLCKHLALREEELCKQVRRTLMSLRQCLEEEATLATVGKKLAEKIVSHFCDPQKLLTLNSGLAKPRLQIYFQMMEGSERERQGYQSLLINNAKQFARLVPRHMKGYRNLKRQPCESIESLILSCMIGAHSSLLDVKRLLTTLKNSNSVLCSSKKALYSQLFRRLEGQAEASQSWELASWCKDQVSQLQSDTLEDWMDIE